MANEVDYSDYGKRFGEDHKVRQRLEQIVPLVQSAAFVPDDERGDRPGDATRRVNKLAESINRGGSK